eukprot:CAMPEP_0181367348 /NCGR_PEP_ID=MMETSP1106-20121128/11331_1 /TAXON_ID=81844 /ORGANISM="Mantoniella antarctica, Strain SL-175" /LENGTH=131 /DNA_ID=CAMNT_0023483041 /DNA_START=385 /DNA_END=776 /DNA_ORIENTATION=+
MPRVAAQSKAAAAQAFSPSAAAHAPRGVRVNQRHHLGPSFDPSDDICEVWCTVHAPPPKVLPLLPVRLQSFLRALLFGLLLVVIVGRGVGLRPERQRDESPPASAERKVRDAHLPLRLPLSCAAPPRHCLL